MKNEKVAGYPGCGGYKLHTQNRTSHNSASNHLQIDNNPLSQHICELQSC